MAVVPENRGGKPALTWFRMLEKFTYCTLLECSLETGRTHQIRVHMLSIRHPLVATRSMASQVPALPEFHRQALHATRLGLVHPMTGFKMQWEVPMPEDMRDLLENLRYG
jgi:23S rRNA pseudouridine1911/1915/1917 synthase